MWILFYIPLASARKGAKVRSRRLSTGLTSECSVGGRYLLTAILVMKCDVKWGFIWDVF